jgi:hypothetical protein
LVIPGRLEDAGADADRKTEAVTQVGQELTRFTR